MLTAGVDVQDNRFEVEVVGWGSEWESWGIEYRVIMGNPSTQEAWDALDEYLLRRWRYGDGTELGMRRGGYRLGRRWSHFGRISFYKTA